MLLTLRRTLTLVSILFPVLANAVDVPIGQLPTSVEPLSYQVDLKIDPSQENFSGSVAIAVKLNQTTDHIWLHGKDLNVLDANLIDDQGKFYSLSYKEMHDSGVAKLSSPVKLPAGLASLEIEYERSFSKSWNGLYSVEHGGKNYAYTQLQALRARKVFPSFDEPRFKVPFQFNLEIPNDLSAVSNATVRRTSSNDNRFKLVEFNATAPVPSYLLAIAVGDFDIVSGPSLPANSIRSREIPLRGIAPKGDGAKFEFALDNTAKLLEILESYFGIPYPYDKLDLVAPTSFGPAGMENVGAIFYKPQRILFDRGLSARELRDFSYLHAHELAHSWFGNLVTPPWWDDLWLNESFATWMSSKALNEMMPEFINGRSPERGGIYAMNEDRYVSSRRIKQPIQSPGDIRTAFNGITYSKGSAVLAMIEKYMGEDAFRDGVRRFMKEHSHQTATSDDFFASMALFAADDSVLKSFKSFVNQPGAPLVEAELLCQSNSQPELRLQQSRSLPLGSAADPDQIWSIPLCVSFGINGERAEQCILFDQRQVTVPLAVGSCPSWLVPNADSSAYLNFSLTDDGWRNLLANFGELSPGDILSVMSSAEAAYHAGHISTNLLLEFATLTARSSDWDLVKSPLRPLRTLKLSVLSKANRDAVLSTLRGIYRPVLERFNTSEAGLKTEPEELQLSLLRSEVVWFMALDAKDPDLRLTLKKLGLSYLGYGQNHRDLRAVHPSLISAAINAAAADGGIDVIEHIIAMMKTTQDFSLKEKLIAALGHQTSPQIVERIRLYIMDPQTKKSDGAQIFRKQAGRGDNSASVQKWLFTNFDEILERLPNSAHRWLVWRVANLCSDNSQKEVEAFFRPKVGDDAARRRSLDNVSERIAICVATKKFHETEAIEAVTSRID